MASRFFTTRGNVEVYSREYWDAWYKTSGSKVQPGQSAWGRPTLPMVEKITGAMKNVQGKQIADLGAGDGRYSIYFAEQGAIVDHVDYSEGAAEMLIRAARARGAALGCEDGVPVLRLTRAWSPSI